MDYEYRTITNTQDYDLDLYNKILPLVGYEIISINSHMSLSGTSKMDKTISIFGKDQISMKNTTKVSTTYTLSLRRNTKKTKKEILKITDEYLYLNFKIKYTPEPRSKIKHILVNIFIYIPILVFLGIIWDFLINFLNIKLSYNSDTILFLIVSFIIWALFILYYNKDFRKIKNNFKIDKGRLEALNKIVEK